MKRITGPRLSLRPVRLSDFTLFCDCYQDWPPDQYGYYTIDRAKSECDAAVRHNRAVTEPLDESSNWTQVLTILAGDVPIGIHRAKAEGTVVTVLNQAFVPEARGKGYMDELQTILQRYAFEVLGATEARFHIIADAAAALAHVQNRDKYALADEPVEGQRGKALRVGCVTREQWQAWTDDRPEHKDMAWEIEQ